MRLRQAAGPNTRLLLADYVLPLACVDEDEDIEPEPTEDGEDNGKKITREPLPGTVRTLAPEGSPLLPNLGKANANAYWLDLTVCSAKAPQDASIADHATDEGDVQCARAHAAGAHGCTRPAGADCPPWDKLRLLRSFWCARDLQEKVSTLQTPLLA